LYEEVGKESPKKQSSGRSPSLPAISAVHRDERLNEPQFVEPQGELLILRFSPSTKKISAKAARTKQL
jgi:hypothetical protein